MVNEEHADVLRERLAVWKGPLPVNVLERPATLADWIENEFGSQVGDVYIDSLKDLAPKLSDDDTGSRVNMARQELLARGVQVIEGHHQRKEQRGEGKPKTLADVYGSRWLTAGAGSVVLLWGEPGDLVVELIHLKQPAEPIGPMKIVHNHRLGVSTVYEARDLAAALEQTPGGMLVTDAARVLFETSAVPTADQREKARRTLNKLVEKGIAERADDPDGTARYIARAESRVTPRDPQRVPHTETTRATRNGSTKPHAPHTDGHGGSPTAYDPLFRGGVRESVTPHDDPEPGPRHATAAETT
jgi:replicative DNA helicase